MSEALFGPLNSSQATEAFPSSPKGPGKPLIPSKDPRSALSTSDFLPGHGSATDIGIDRRSNRNIDGKMEGNYPGVLRNIIDFVAPAPRKKEKGLLRGIRATAATVHERASFLMRSGGKRRPNSDGEAARRWK